MTKKAATATTEASAAPAAATATAPAVTTPSAEKRFLYPMRWVMVRMPMKQKKATEAIIRQALRTYTQQQTQEIATYVKTKLDAGWDAGCGPSWQVVVGKTFTYNVAFTRGTAGLITFGDQRESTLFLYRSAPFAKERPTTYRVDLPEDVKRSDGKEQPGEHIETNMSADLLAVTCSLIRKARAATADETEQATQVKEALSKYAALLPEYQQLARTGTSTAAAAAAAKDEVRHGAGEGAGQAVTVWWY